MAHPVELVLKLDSQDAERVLKDLQRKADAGKSAGRSGADEFSGAMKDVRAAIVSSGVLRAVDDLAKSLGGLGQKTQEQVSKITEAGQRIAMAAAAGGPYAAAFVGVLEALGATFKKLSERSEEFNRRLEEQRKIREAARQGEQGRQQRRQDLEQSYGEYQAKRREDRLLEGGNWGAQVEYLDRLRKRRAALVEQAEAGFSDETDYRGSRAAEEGMEALEEVKELDAAIKRFEDALKKSSDQIDKEREAREKERKRLEEEQARRAAELQGARQRWDFGREADEARENGNVQWIQSQMALARERMGGAQDAQQFNQAASDFQRLESALKQVEETQRKKAEEEQRAGAAALQERFKQLTGIGSAVSDYTAAGFSMGENFGPLDGISRDVQEIVRLMQESAWRSKAAGATLY